MTFHHPSHPMHELELKNYQKPYICDGCRQPGFGSRYRCESCNYDLHRDCIFPLQSFRHEFFPNSTFTFLNKPPKACCHGSCIRCDACGKEIHGFLYHCEEHDWDLHPCCRNLQNKYSIDGLELKLQKKARSKCIWCKKKDVKGWSYISDCEKFQFHVSCITEMVMEEWSTNGDCERVCFKEEEMPLERVNLKAIRARGHGGHGSKFWRIVKVLFKTIACILLGDPTITLACLLVDLLA